MWCQDGRKWWVGKNLEGINCNLSEFLLGLVEPRNTWQGVAGPPAMIQTAYVTNASETLFFTFRFHSPIISSMLFQIFHSALRIEIIDVSCLNPKGVMSASAVGLITVSYLVPCGDTPTSHNADILLDWLDFLNVFCVATHQYLTTMLIFCCID